jgi:hypothetical protein
VVIDAYAHRTGRGLDELRQLRASDEPDLRGGHHYVDSARHVAYVDSATYQRVLAEIRDRFGFADPDDAFYALSDVDVCAVRADHLVPTE